MRKVGGLLLLAVWAGGALAQVSDARSRSLSIPKDEHVVRAFDPLARQRYGFRTDPLPYVTNADTVPAAQVRSFVLHQPKPGDAALLAGALAQRLAKQNADGSYGAGEEKLATTHETLAAAVALGADAKRPEVARIIAFLRGLPADTRTEDLRFHSAASLVRLGLESFPGLGDAQLWLAEHPDQWIGTGCPWTPTLALESLWLAPQSELTQVAIDRGLAWLDRVMNAAGCIGYWDPWALMELLTRIDRPEARQLLARQMPMALRAQEADGGWGANSLAVWRALTTLDCVERLRALPPLPADWEVVRSLPVGELDGFSLVYGAGSLWTLADGQAVAISPGSGAVTKRLPLPAGKSFALTWFDGTLAVVQKEPKRLLKLDLASGAVQRTVSLDTMAAPLGAAEINHRLYLGDGWKVGGWTIDPRRPKLLREQPLAAPGPLLLTAADSWLWQVDYWTPTIVASDLAGRLKAWGEKPFGEATAGLAWDGERLWALDGRTRRICALRPANRPFSEQDLAF